MSEGKRIKNKIVAEVSFTEFEIDLLLKTIGHAQNVAMDRGANYIPYERLINKIYRSMGIKL